ncbi:MAG: hypothetical protein HC774_03375 [Sphingomonadales bacterium]|nr:hypothetical protein [Sphingomonadales bacterium]
MPEKLLIRIRQRLTDATGKERFVGLVSLFAVEAGITLIHGIQMHNALEKQGAL